MEKNYKQIIEEVYDLGTKSAILSSRGWDTKEIDEKLSKLYDLNPKAYSEGYEKVKGHFGLV